LRRAGGGQRFVTTMTLYDGLETVEITNEGGPWDGAWAFDPSPDATRLSWAQPLAAAGADGVVGEEAIDGWFAAHGEGGGALLVACPTGGVVWRAADGRIGCRGPASGMRFRLAFTRVMLPEDPWRLASSMVPLVALRTSGAGDVTLPGFGRLLDVRDPGARLLGLL
jgi:hypothetical protein